MRLFLRFFAATLIATPAFAAPDAGQSLQQIKQQTPLIPESSTPLVIESPATAKHTPGGPKVTVDKIAFHGNTVFTNDQLLAVLGDLRGKSFDLAGLKTLADRITTYYHAEGYPFARALIPTQNSSAGTLQIEIVEGRYGTVKLNSTDPRAAQAEKFLAPLHPGALIENDTLERTSLILSDQPGYSETPVIRPGQTVGTGDLDVTMKRDARLTGSVGLDNGGDRYTGRLRARADLAANSPLMFGDQFTLSSLYTQENLWFGALGYNAPLGTSGLRGNVGYTHTYYELGKQFSALDANGTADVASAGLSYPIVRSQQINLSASATYQHKWLNDDQGATGTDTDKSSDSLPLALNFDLRDTLGGGGLTYGAASWTHGVLDLDHALKATDSTTARSNGGYDKFNLDLARLQSLPANFSAFARFSGQYALNNLDSSEKFGLGGPTGVRAYPTGEGFGDQGYFAQVELRYQIGQFAPYTFYDQGHVDTNHDAFAAGSNGRTLSGAGFGTRIDIAPFTADASLAWRTEGGDPTSDTKHDSPMIWASLGYKF